MTVAQYWATGSATEATLVFTPRIMEAHLMQDWVPSFPPLTGPALVSWPSLLTETCVHAGGSYLALSPVAGRAERQWKTFLSWMAGVCGTRQVLTSERYDWIAPASAFYPERALPVDVVTPPRDFVPALLRVAADPENPAHLRPDYVAIRADTSGGGWHLALVESKGIRHSLASRGTCPADWHQQVRNAVVSYDGVRIQPDRYLVVAARANPNAARGWARRFQIRGWNAEERVMELPNDAAVEVAAAALYGTCRNLGLRQTAARLALANAERSLVRSGGRALQEVRKARERQREGSRRELEQSERRPLSLPGVNLHVDLSQETVGMIELLSRPEVAEVAATLRTMSLVRSARSAEPRPDGALEVSGIIVRAEETD